MKTSKAILIIIGFLGAAFIVGGTVFVLTNNFLNKKAASDGCKTTGTSHSVTIQNDSFSDKQVSAKLCDTLTITNKDDKVRNIAFGERDNHEPYDGVTEKILQKNGTFTVTLNKTGTYEIHDHLQDETQAFFTVTN